MDKENQMKMRLASAKSKETTKYIAKTKPYPRKPKDILELITAFERLKLNYFNTEINLKMNWQTAPRHCSLRQLDELEPIRLKDMLVNQRHTGKYLRCRVVGEPFFMAALTGLVEDEDGDVEILHVYNSTPDYEIDATDLLPRNSVIAIKEPYVKIMIENNENYYIRVESPTDIVILEEHDIAKWKLPEVKFTYDELNDRGNKLFLKKEYRKAVKSYTQALKINKTAKTYANRAAAYLEIEMFQEALLDAQESARLEPNEKAYYRMGKAAYGMRLFTESADYFRKCLEVNEKNKKASEELKRVEERIKESQTGNYDMKRIVEELKSGKLRLDVADYMSNSIKIEEVEGKGKGIVATEDIKRGTLIVASKAVSISYESELDIKVMSTNFYTEKADSPADNQNLFQLIYKLQHDPNLAKQVYALYSGQNVKRSQEVPDKIVDSIRVELILTYNSDSSFDFKQTGPKKEEDEDDENSGLWIIPSYFNHACDPNTVKFYLKDFAMVYTIKDIRKGEELTNDWLGSLSYKKRQEKCAVQYGFKCECEMCVHESSDPNLEKREALLEEVARLKQLQRPPKEPVLLRLYNSIKNTYTSDQPYRYRFFEILELLVKYYDFNHNYKREAECFRETFDILRDSHLTAAASMIANASMCYLYKANMPQEAKAAMKIAKSYLVGSPYIYDYAYGINHCPS